MTGITGVIGQPEEAEGAVCGPEPHCCCAAGRLQGLHIAAHADTAREPHHHRGDSLLSHPARSAFFAAHANTA